MKLLVQVTSAHLYINPDNGQEISPFRPTVVDSSPYVNSLTAAGKLKVLNSELLDEATDKDFAKFFKESDKDTDLAVSAFMSKFGSVKDESEQAKKVAAAAAVVTKATAPETPAAKPAAK